MNDHEIATLLRAATAARQSGALDTALQQFNRARAAAPDNPVVLNALAVHLLEVGDAAAAEPVLRQAIKADPQGGALWLNLAKACRMQGDTEGEGQALEGALRVDQRDLTALIRQAELFDRLGDQTRAAQRWGGVLSLLSGIRELSPELQPVVAHARAVVERENHALAAALEQGLAALRGQTDARTRRRFDAFADHILGRRTFYTNQCEGLYYPFLPADEFFDREHFPWMAALEAKTGVIRAEFEALMTQGAPGFRPYVDQIPGTPVNKWTPLDKSPDWSAYFLWKDGARVDSACSLCPATADALEAIPRTTIHRRAPTAFFSLLRPYTHIPPHTGVTNTRTIIHLPLIVPEGCGFRVGGETRQWREGEAFAFDDTIEHEAWNDSDQLRVLLILDVWNPHLSHAEQQLISASYATMDAHGNNPEPFGAA